MKTSTRNKLGIAAAVLLAAVLSSAVFGVIATIIILAVLITLHEFGHWSVARLFGIEVPVFSVGFGSAEQARTLGRFWGTQFQLRPVPLGGFIQPDEKSYVEASFTGRALMMAAGPLMNLIIPVVLFFVLFASTGVPVPGEIKDSYVAGLSTQADAPARQAGLSEGDIFVSVEGVPVRTPDDLSAALASRRSQPTSITVIRDGKSVGVSVVPDENGKIGIQLAAHADYTMQPVGTGQAAGLAFKRTGSLLWQTLGAWADLFRGQGLSQMQSVVGIVHSGSQAVNSGIASGVYFASVLSIALAVLNFLPLPGLDGGQLMLLGIEKVRGRPLNPRTQSYLVSVVVALFLMLFAYALYNDFVRLFGERLAAPLEVLVVCMVAMQFLPGQRGGK